MARAGQFSEWCSKELGAAPGTHFLTPFPLSQGHAESLHKEVFHRYRVPQGSVLGTPYPAGPWLPQAGFQHPVLHPQAPEQPGENICRLSLKPRHPLQSLHQQDFTTMPALRISLPLRSQTPWSLRAGSSPSPTVLLRWSEC